MVVGEVCNEGNFVVGSLLGFEVLGMEENVGMKNVVVDRVVEVVG